jgi:2-aminoadipate transaminase
VETCARLGLPLIEDDPYGALSYKGEPYPKMVAMNPDGVIYMGSFSKVLTPGIRLGYVVRRCRWCAAWNWPSRRPTCTPRS